MANILYLHGFASGPKPNSPKVALLRGLGHQVQCLSTEGRYRPADYLNAFHQRTKQAPLPDLFVGTSLGGFWARHLGCRLERAESSAASLANPVAEHRHAATL